MRNLASSSFIILMLCSCSSSLYKTAETTEQLPAKEHFKYSWFRNDSGRALYNCSVEVFGSSFSGLLFIKPLGDTHRILFITETGIKVFDMEFTRNEKMKVWYCMEAIDRKTITGTLGNDLYLMLYNIADNGTARNYTDNDCKCTVIKSKDTGGSRYCYISEINEKPEKLVKTGGFRWKMKIDFYGGRETVPDSLKLTHNNLKLTIQLNRINETGTEISE